MEQRIIDTVSHYLTGSFSLVRPHSVFLYSIVCLSENISETGHFFMTPGLPEGVLSICLFPCVHWCVCVSVRLGLSQGQLIRFSEILHKVRGQ